MAFLLPPDMLFKVSKLSSLSFHDMINNNLEYNGYFFKGLLVGLFVTFCLARMQKPHFFYQIVTSQFS